MMEIIFYPQDSQLEPQDIKVSKEFLQWLAGSKFMAVGTDLPTKINIQGEEAELPLMPLEQGNNSNRQLLTDFLRDAIILESEKIIENLGDDPSKEEYQKLTYPLKKLHELRRCVENETYQYLQRA
ncbi:MAG: hypothetical protein ACRC8Y_00285 [Chroococcales cyanobacterium]